jgi:thiamine-monophosphate kinase
LAAHPGVHAAIDISDGIAKDAATLCYENSLGLELFVDRLPASRPLRSLATQLETDWLDWFLTGGEDYELLFAADRSFDGGRSEGARLWPIGRFSNKETGIVLVMPDGTRSGLKTGGWDHLV